MRYCEAPEMPAADHAIEFFAQVWPWIPMLIMVLPLVIFDVVRCSNLFVGPVYRLKQHLAVLSENSECRPLKFRDGDHWQEIAPPINALQLQILGLEGKIIAYETILAKAGLSGLPDSKSVPKVTLGDPDENGKLKLEDGKPKAQADPPKETFESEEATEHQELEPAVSS